MAVRTDIYGKGDRVRFEGCVLNLWERNGSWDSDFYATVWDDAEGRVRDVEYDTTRCGGGGSAEIDATDETLRKAYRYYFNSARRAFDEHGNENQARRYGKGDEVRVIKGRKVKAGTVGKCFWRGKTYNKFSRMYEDRMGIEVDGQRVFISAENCEHAQWEQRLLTGAARKEKIRTEAVLCMPHWARSRFAPRRCASSVFSFGGGFFAV